MGFKDLQVLVLLVWLCLGHMFEVGAQIEAPSGLSPPPPSFGPLNDALGNSTGVGRWNVGREAPTYKILGSRNGDFVFDLLLTNQSKSSCAATVRHASSNTVVWVANFNSSNSNGQSSTNSVEACSLYFVQDVGLVLNSSNVGEEIWSTRGLNLSRGEYFDTLQLDNSGCLSIRDSAEKSSKAVWKSFDYPGDTLVKGQQLVQGASMSAAQLNQAYSTGGIFSMRIEGRNMALYQDFKADGVSSNISYSSFSNNTQNNSQNDTLNDMLNITYIQVENSLIAFYGPNGETNRSLFSMANWSENWDFARLESNGGLVLKTYASGLQRELVGNGKNCSLPAECGSFGICLQNGSCTCPEGFANSTTDGRFTCQRMQLLDTVSSDCSNNTMFVNITGQAYLYPPNLSEPDWGPTACLTRCQGECNCTNALHVRRASSGACFLNLDSMQTISQVVDNGDVQTLFLRIPWVINGSSPPVAGGASSRRTAALAFAGVAGALVLVLLAASTWWLVYTRRKYFDEVPDRGLANSALAGKAPSQLPPQFSYKQLADSTSNFAQRLGYGGMSSVYAGNLANTNTKIAVKKLDDKGHKDKAFLAAVATMSSLSHPNLVPLVGYCKEGKHKLLVYELVNEGRSLNWFLFNTHNSGPLLDASTRRAIALGTARGLQHLHEDYNTGGVIHGGVKPENIMIGRDMRPKLVDYGLVNLSSRFASLHSADSRGSRGYMAPEWMNLSAPLTSKADVYSLGVVILELVSGRRCLVLDASPEERRFLPSWGFAMLRRDDTDLDSVLELADPRLDLKALSHIDQQVLKGMTFVALWCVQEDPGLRPSMDQVVRMLEGDHTVNVPPLSPALDAFARDLCASQQQGGEQLQQQQPEFMHSPSLSENSDMRPR